MHSAIAFLNFRRAKPPSPVRRGILMGAVLAATAVLAMAAPAKTIESSRKLAAKIEHFESVISRQVFASLRPGLAQLRHNRPPVYSPRRAKLDDMSIAYGAYVNGDFITALRIIEPLAEKGDLRAQYILGYMHENGHVTNQDFALAAKWYRMAAEQGDAISEISLGLLYEHGKGVAKDFAEAAKLYRSAADRGSARAHYRLGVMYRYGQGVPLDLVMAHVHFNIAATGFTVLPAQAGRESVAREMTSAQLELARQIAREWLTLHPAISVREPAGNALE
jgi:TPR repeat protein